MTPVALHCRRRGGARPVHAVVVALVAALAAGCETTPTGRTQLQLFPDSQVAQMGDAAFAQLRRTERTVTGTSSSRFVQCVARAVTAVVPPPVGGGTWDVTVFEDDAVNAFALPGGHIGVNTGLLRAARTPAQLAAVIGHEVAHVQAEHSNARLSTQFATDAGLALVQALGQGTAVESRQAMALLGLGAQVGVLLPFGRAQETEADELGLRYMADAGFDPAAAPQLWRQMAQAGGASGPALLSTHPTNEQRIDALQDALPQAQVRYRQARAAGRRPGCERP